MDLAPLHAHADAAAPVGPQLLVLGGLLALLAIGALGAWLYVRHRFPA
jgi:hypothetical protein